MIKIRISDYLDNNGDLLGSLKKKDTERAKFAIDIIESTTLAYPVNVLVARIKCIRPGCKGYVYSKLTNKSENIQWKCNKCGNGGEISEWQGTKWNAIKSLGKYNEPEVDKNNAGKP